VYSLITNETAADWGTYVMVHAYPPARQGTMLNHLLRWYTAGEALKMAAGDNGRLLALSGPRNPYPAQLGVIEEGAYADLLIVDGNPVENMGSLPIRTRTCASSRRTAGFSRVRSTLSMPAAVRADPDCLRIFWLLDRALCRGRPGTCDFHGGCGDNQTTAESVVIPVCPVIGSDG